MKPIKQYTTISLLFIVFIVLLSFKSDEVNENNYYLVKPPAGVVKVAENFYCDKSEIANVNWREYLFWIKKVFGGDSKEYRSALPDTMVWLEKDICLKSYCTSYLSNPEYDFYPLVGISQKQAVDFSKWRSDRVFEGILIDLHKITEDREQTRETCFTIERYFKGTLKSILPGNKVYYYPYYGLPDFDQRKLVLLYADSIDKAYFDRCKSKFCKDCKTHNFKWQTDVPHCRGHFLIPETTRSINESCSAKNDQGIYNLRGNVSEWASEPGIAFGGGWTDTRERILQSDTFSEKAANAWTGFRNVCAWKKWKE